MRSNIYDDTSEPFLKHSYSVSSVLAAARNSPTGQDWSVVDTKGQGETLFINGELQSCKKDEYIYHEMFVHSLLQGCQNPERVLILGGAEGCMLREVLRWSSVKQVTQIDWDEPLVEFFKSMGSSWNGGAYKDPRLKLLCLDAFEWIKQTTETFDAIFVDFMDPKDSETLVPLLELLKGILNPNGGISINAGQVHISARGPTPALLLATSMRKIFPDPLFGRVAMKVCVPSFLGEWCFLMITSHQWSSNISRSTYTPKALRRFTFLELTQCTRWTSDYPEELVNFWIKESNEMAKKLTPPIDDNELINFHYD
jgi:spermidine synthase